MIRSGCFRRHGRATTSTSAMEKEFKQFSAYILAAEYAWSGQETLPDDLPYRADEVFRMRSIPCARCRRSDPVRWLNYPMLRI